MGSLFQSINKSVIEPILKGNNKLAFQNLEELNKSYDGRPELNYAHAVIAHHVGDLLEAERKYKAAISRCPPFIDLFVNYVVLLHNQGRFRESIKIAKAAYKLSPNEERVVVPYLTALLDTAQTKDALKVIEELKFPLREAKNIQLAEAACYRHDSQRDKALSILDQVINKHPKDIIAHRMVADILGDQSSELAIDKYKEAISLAKAQSKDGALAAVLWNMSLHLLRLRRFAEGWAAYEYGLSKDVGTLGRKLAVSFRHLPNLDEVQTRTGPKGWILVIVEQGIGDQVIFFSAFREFLDEFKRVAILCEPRMMPLIKRSFPEVQLLYPGIVEFLDQSDPPFFAYVPLGSIMKRYRLTVESFTDNRNPYLRVDRDRYIHYRKQLKSQARGRTIVGISWKGGFWENQQKNKTISLSEWSPILNKNALFVNLQYGEVANDLAWASSQGYKIADVASINFKSDLDDWLALACACDGIVSISTSLVHFAGAAGQKVIVILPEVQGPHIWGVADTRSILYKNVEIIRPKQSGGLEEVIQLAASRLN